MTNKMTETMPDIIYAVACESGPNYWTYQDYKRTGYGIQTKYIRADLTDKLVAALKLIKHEGSGCGCSPVCQCNSEGSMRVRLEVIHDVADEALNEYEENK